VCNNEIRGVTLKLPIKVHKSETCSRLTCSFRWEICCINRVYYLPLTSLFVEKLLLANLRLCSEFGRVAGWLSPSLSHLGRRAAQKRNARLTTSPSPALVELQCITQSQLPRVLGLAPIHNVALFFPFIPFFFLPQLASSFVVASSVY
jgi:hypothetical protein